MRKLFPIGCIVGMAALACVSSAGGTMVLWYGANCIDDTGAHLENGDLVQLIRSPDGTIGAPDSVTGEPTGNDSVAASAVYAYPDNVFQGEDWQEAGSNYVCVRIWDAGSAAAGKHYWDSKVYQASGMLPVDIDCAGAKTATRK